MDKMITFYIVWRENGGNPTKKYERYNDACDEAERLAKKHPECDFHVLQSMTTMFGKIIVETVHHDFKVADETTPPHS